MQKYSLSVVKRVHIPRAQFKLPVVFFSVPILSFKVEGLTSRPQLAPAECDPDIQDLVGDMLDLSTDFECAPDSMEATQHEMQESEEEIEADLLQIPEELETNECTQQSDVGRHSMGAASMSITPAFRIVGDNIDRKVLLNTISIPEVICAVQLTELSIFINR